MSRLTPHARRLRDRRRKRDRAWRETTAWIAAHPGPSSAEAFAEYARLRQYQYEISAAMWRASWEQVFQRMETMTWASGGVSGGCVCELDPYEYDDPAEDDGEESWHYKRTCSACGEVWWSLHCPHDGVQNPCPACGWRPPSSRTPMEFLGFARPPGA